MARCRSTAAVRARRLTASWCDDVTVGDEDTVVEVYLTGCFNKNALIVADGYELTDDDMQTLRNGGIFVEHAVKM